MQCEFEVWNLDLKKCGNLIVQGNFFDLKKNSTDLLLYSSMASGLISKKINIFLMM